MASAAEERKLETIATTSTGFVVKPSGRSFTPWGFNYDHDEHGRLIEDYWEAEWPKIEEDFREMKQLGANVVRIHLQFAKFISPTNRVNEQSLAQLQRLVQLAQRTGLYLDVTGLGCYHRRDWAAWYDALSESERWAAQALFWRAIAKQCRNSPAIFCYDLMNEPVVPGGKQTNWLAGAFGGKHFVQFISRDPRGRKRYDMARAWTEQLTAAVRAEDPQHLITIGLVDWSLERPGLSSGFVPTSVIDSLDFLAVHIYPERGKVDDALAALKGFGVGKPVVIEETFPLKCSVEEFREFVDRSRTGASGWIGFYWGKTPDELRKSKTIGDALTLQWLEYFQQASP